MPNKSDAPQKQCKGYSVDGFDIFRRVRGLLCCLLIVCVVIFAVRPLQSRPIDLVAPRGVPERFLRLDRLSGQVIYTRVGQPPRPAQRGDLLVTPGDRIETQAGSTADLHFDDGIGLVRMSQQTVLFLERLDILPDGGKRTRIQVRGGQALFKIRRFTRRSSDLEVVTPAGVAGVRGTEFGVSIDAQGRSAVATQEGQVVASAEQREVSLKAGLQSLVVPGQPPGPPQAAATEARLYGVRFDRRSDSQTPEQVELVARTDPGNLVRVFGKLQPTDLDGRFRLETQVPTDRYVPVEVTTPLGAQKTFNLTVLLP